jgi:hypothetical protein
VGRVKRIDQADHVIHAGLFLCGGFTSPQTIEFRHDQQVVLFANNRFIHIFPQQS